MKLQLKRLQYIYFYKNNFIRTRDSFLLNNLRTNQEQLRLKILKKLRTANLNSEFNGSYK